MAFPHRGTNILCRCLVHAVVDDDDDDDGVSVPEGQVVVVVSPSLLLLISVSPGEDAGNKSRECLRRIGLTAFR